MKRYTQEGIRQAVQTIADAYLSMYETMRDQKTVTIADDTVIQKLRKMGFPRQGRPLDNVVGEMLEDVCTNQRSCSILGFSPLFPALLRRCRGWETS